MWWRAALYERMNCRLHWPHRQVDCIWSNGDKSRPRMTRSFVVVLCHSNNMSDIYWQWYDVWDEEEKALAYTFTDSRIFNLPHHICLVWQELAFDDDISYTQWRNGLQHSLMLWQWQEMNPSYQCHQPSAVTNWAISPPRTRSAASNRSQGIWFPLFASSPHVTLVSWSNSCPRYALYGWLVGLFVVDLRRSTI